MKTYFLFLFLILSTNLSANQAPAKVLCVDNQLQLFITSQNLNLTNEAIVDNTGGYVDIPEEIFYVKTALNIYKVYGKVVKNTQNINQFQAQISKDALQNLPLNQKIELIQKIDLIQNNQELREKNITTTNKLTLQFEKSNLNSALKECFK